MAEEKQMLKQEQWRQIPTHEHYEVSDLGRVRNSRGRILSPGEAGRNPSYLQVDLCGHGARARYVHQLVLEAFIGPCPQGHEAAHDNGNSLDNRRRNLCWKTTVENAADKLRHGTLARGSTNAASKLSEEAVFAIRKAGKDITNIALAKEHGVHHATISRARRAETWAHV